MYSIRFNIVPSALLYLGTHATPRFPNNESCNGNEMMMIKEEEKEEEEEELVVSVMRMTI